MDIANWVVTKWCCRYWNTSSTWLLLYSSARMKRMKRDISKYPRDKIILFQLPRCLYAPSFSPFPLKLETYLRMANIPYEVGELRDDMMTSSNGNVFRVTGHLFGEFTGHRWIPRTKASDAELWCFLLIWAWTNGWLYNRDAGDLRCLRAHYDVTVMETLCGWHMTRPVDNVAWRSLLGLLSWYLIIFVRSLQLNWRSCTRI